MPRRDEREASVSNVAAGAAAEKCVLLTKVVASPTPFHWTTLPLARLDYVNVTIRVDPPAVTSTGESDANVGTSLR